MSSDYDALCLSHDPAIILGMDESSYDAALHRARIDHPRCDLVVGRWSGGLVELCCPAMPVDREDQGKPHSGWHRDPIWADAGLLHIAAVVVQRAENDVALETALRKLPMCWTPQRLRLLSRVLGVPDGQS